MTINAILEWGIVTRHTQCDPPTPLPSSIVTVAPRFQHEEFPDAAALLLPTSDGAQSLVRWVSSLSGDMKNVAAGLFMANPLLNVSLEGQRLSRAGVKWIASFPTVAQQDIEFVQQLGDVGLDSRSEATRLRQFQDQGFETIAATADSSGADVALDADPSALLVVPRLIDYASGFPAVSQRQRTICDVVGVIDRRHWTGSLLCLGTQTDALAERLWPDRLDGVVWRSRLIASLEGAIL